ncbi:MAG TPA: plastocyanin/azurin family copper-binding protein [Opitutaceae bacterium]|nr:plastocyanin/azurin family copper-binding protein [Opitutaceae bacterium]
MKPPSLLLLSSCLLLVGCGKKESAEAPAAAAPNGAAVFTLTADDTMKYNLTRLEAAAGQTVQLTLTNVGTLPKQAMAHNWILLKRGDDPAAFANAAVAHQAQDYFPPELASEVLAHTRLLGPKQSDTITFKAPAEPGEYPFLCSFPAHFLTGMKGVLVVH